MKNKALLAVAILLVVLLAIFFHKSIFSNRVFFIQDIIYQFHPFRVFAAESIQSGELPLWNPYIYSGTPFIANLQSAVFYPFTILFYIFSFSFAIKSFVLIHLLLAGIFMYLLLEAFKLKRWSAIAGAVLFMFNGYIIARIQFLSILGSVIWLPLMFLIVRDYTGRPVEASHRKYFHIGLQAIVSSLVITFQFMAGHTQLLIYSMAFIFAYILANSVFKIDETVQEKPARLWTKISVVAVLALGMSMIQFMPAVEFIRNSIRSAGVEYGVATAWSLRPAELLNLIYPAIIINLFPGTDNLWSKCFYTGIIPPVLFLTGFFSKKNNIKMMVYLGSIFVLVLLLALGNSSPLYRIMYDHFPLFKILRYPSSIMFLAVFVLSIGASFGLNNLTRKGIFGSGLPFIIIFLITADLFMVNARLNLVINEKLFSAKGDKLEYLANNCGNSRFMLTPDAQFNRRAAGTNYYNAWVQMKDNLYSDINMPFHCYNAGGQDLRVSWYDDYLNSIESSNGAEKANKLLNIAGVKYVLSRKKIQGGSYKLVKDGTVKIYENVMSLPRAWLAGSGRVMEREKMLELFKSGSLNPFTYVLLDSDEGIVKSGLSAIKGAESKSSCPVYDNNKAGCHISSYSPENIGIEVMSQKPCWLVLSDTYFPGWKAYADGIEQPVYRANYFMRAVYLSGKEKNIRFKYTPIAFMVGSLISILSIIFIFRYFYRCTATPAREQYCD